MEFGRLNTFCCCGLRAGAIVAAVITALSVLIDVVNGILLLNTAEYYDDRKQHEDAVKVWRILGGIALTQAIIGFIALVLLCIGIYKNRAPFILPWLIIYCILIILSVIGSIYTLVVEFAANYLINLLLHIFMVYVWFGVWSFYHDLKEGKVSSANTQGRVV